MEDYSKWGIYPVALHANPRRAKEPDDPSGVADI